MPKQIPATDVFEQVADEDGPVAAPPEIPSGIDQPSPETPPAAAAASRWHLLVALTCAVALTAMGLAGFLGWRLIQADQTATAGRAALEAAKQYAVTLTTLDSGDIDKNYADVLAGATGQFKDEYSQGAAQLRKILIDNKAAGKGVVLDAAVKSATRTRVEVLLFVDQSVQNAVLRAPRIDRNRVQMTMELVDHRWLASSVEIV